MLRVLLKIKLPLIKSCFQAAAAAHLATSGGCQLPLNVLSIISLFTHQHIYYLMCI